MTRQPDITLGTRITIGLLSVFAAIAALGALRGALDDTLSHASRLTAVLLGVGYGDIALNLPRRDDLARWLLIGLLALNMAALGLAALQSRKALEGRPSWSTSCSTSAWSARPA